jgi:hypothetical protein
VRCYAALALWAPGWNALETANVSALLALLLALAWRCRGTMWPLAAAMGALVSLKLYLWPVLVWAAVSGRGRGAVLALGIAVALTVSVWALIDFAGVERYRELLDRIAEQESYSLKTIVLDAGLGPLAVYAVVAVVTACLLGLCLRFGRQNDDERALAVAVLAALAISPVVWLHYLVLLAVPLGIMRPRFSPLWVLPIVLWVCPRSGIGDPLTEFLPLAVAAIIVGALLVRPRHRTLAVAA